MHVTPRDVTQLKSSGTGRRLAGPCRTPRKARLRRTQIQFAKRSQFGLRFNKSSKRKQDSTEQPGGGTEPRIHQRGTPITAGLRTGRTRTAGEYPTCTTASSSGVVLNRFPPDQPSDSKHPSGFVRPTSHAGLSAPRCTIPHNCQPPATNHWPRRAAPSSGSLQINALIPNTKWFRSSYFVCRSKRPSVHNRAQLPATSHQPRRASAQL